MRRIVLFFAFISLLLTVRPQADLRMLANEELFENNEILEIKLYADFDALLKDRTEERESHPAVLIYENEEGEEIKMEHLKLKLRGNFRRKRSTCGFPPIRLNFAKKKTVGTIFEGQDKLKLVTHCQTKSDNFEQYVLQERAIYKMYNLVSDNSFLTRLIHITYIDSSGKYETFDKYAFLIEDEELMAERLGGKPFELKGFPASQMEQKTLCVLGLFQYMIGNTDWSVPYMHNIKMIQRDGIDSPIPVPYDFDWSGLIAAPYAHPNPMFKIESVKQRVYRGFCTDPEYEEQATQTFLDHKDEIISTIADDPMIEEKVKKRSLKYLISFYKTLESDKARKNRIFALCRN